MHSVHHLPVENMSSQETSNKQAWIVCFSAALFFFYEFIQMNFFNAISPQLLASFSMTADQLAKLSSYYFYANLFFLFPAGLILDRFSTRKVILSSMFVCVLGTFLFSLSTQIHTAAIFRFLTGIGSAFCFLSCIRLASRWFPARKMALISGLIVTMAMLGGFVAQTPMTKLTEMIGWRHTVMLDAGFGLLIMLLIASVVKDYPESKKAHLAQQKDQLKEIGFFSNARQAYFNTQNWLCGLYTCLMNMPVSVLGALMGQLYLEQVQHFSPTDASIITSMIFLGTVVGSPTAGFISDKLGRRKLPMLVGSVISLLIVAMIMSSIHPSFWSLLFLFLALGFFSSTQVISYPTVAESNSPIITASAVSVVSFSVISGYPIAQQLFGRFLDNGWNQLKINNEPIYSAANFHHAMMLLPIGFIIAFFLSLFIKETRCKPSSENSSNHSRLVH